MIKLIKSKTKQEPVIKKMGDMDPLEVCVIMEGSCLGNVVLRTIYETDSYFEIIDLSNLPNLGSWCCLKGDGLKVRELLDGEEYMLRLSK